MSHHLHSRYFEDYQVGQSGITDGRTVSETDVSSFAWITGDFNQIHINAEAGKASVFGGRIAHGLLTTTITTGLLHLHSPVLGMEPAGLRFRAIDARYTRPVLFGYTVRVRWQIKNKRDDESDPTRGIIETRFEVINEKSEAVADGEVTTSVLKKSAAKSEKPGRKTAPRSFTQKISPPDYSKLYYFDDFAVGQGDFTGARTITEADVVNFCGIAGNYHPAYLDEEYAKNNGYGGRVVPEMIGLGMGFGLLYRDAAILVGNRRAGARGGHLGDKMEFLAPLRIGDTMRCYWEIARLRPSQSQADRGIIHFTLKIVNQRNEIVQEGEVGLMAGRKTS